MKELYISPEIEVFEFDAKDIITSSDKPPIELPPVPIWPN